MIYLLKKFFMRMFHFHTWSEWKTFDQGNIEMRERYMPLTGAYIQVGKYIYQSRKCTVCGIIKFRYEETIK